MISASHRRCRRFVCLGLAVLTAALFAAVTPGSAGQVKPGDSPMLGGGPSRNPVNTTAKNVPTDWSVTKGKLKNIKWAATTGTRGYGAPVIAGGRVFVSTNNRIPRDPKVKEPKAVIMCFDEKDGKFLWQALHDMPPEQANGHPVDTQAIEDGMCSIPAVVGEHLYFVTPACVVVCAETATGKTVWQYDMIKELKAFPCIINACSPLVVGDLVFVVTGNGVDDDGKVVSPKAPSFVALDRKTGKPRWQSNLPGNEIIHGQWSNPVYAEVKGKGQVIFPGGDGYLYSFEPQTGKLIWKFRCVPPVKKGEDKSKRNYIVATPVVHGERLYVALGAAPETGFGDRVGHFFCIDITRTGDVSPAGDNFDPKSPANKGSALVWHYGGEVEQPGKTRKQIVFGRTLSSAAAHDGLVYITEQLGILHCLDAQTGKLHWKHDLLTEVWGSPYWVDGRVYIAADDGAVYIFAHGGKKKEIGEVDMEEVMNSTPVVANGVLYITTKSKVYAIGAK